ncbi:Ribosomal protein S8e/ribosomal biogenesis NSA2 [Apiospora marii]|uniref:Ribosome biogenesis protein NSA2 n=1 Tax=Apiospora marii TaxID=335849 RepID=A0ABR1S7J3_9PEZI
MPQNEYMDRHRRLHGRRFDHDERSRKKEARQAHKQSEDAQNLRGLRAKLNQQKRHKEKIQMRKQLKAHEERDVKSAGEKDPSAPLPNYLLDRSNPSTAKALSTSIKQKRKDQAARLFKVLQTGKKVNKKSWKRMPLVRPMGLRYKKAHVTHPTLGVTVMLPIIGVKKNPSNPLYTQLGVLSKGTILEINVSELGLTTTQVTNNPENDGCVNAVLLV